MALSRYNDAIASVESYPSNTSESLDESVVHFGDNDGKNNGIYQGIDLQQRW